MDFLISEIADWTLSNSKVTIPAIQRGLVWKPSQVELLWDSILRGFPIGSFMLSENDNCTYYLMDGQQRFNAISLGFNKVPNARSIIWIDLMPSDDKKSTRKFWIKTTTIAHPWGYNNNDDATCLTASEKRSALKEFFPNSENSIYNNDIKLKDTWPIKANIPIPLFCLLKGAENAENADQFVQNTLNCFNSSEFIFKKHFEITEKAKNYLKELFYVIKKLAEYHISCNILRKDIIETESKGDDNKQTPIEVLFNRAATKGTPISKDDLNYAAIKSYWPTIKEENDRLSEQYMNPSKLVMLAFRLALTSENENSLKNELDINQIRALSKNNEKREKIETLYKSNLEKILTLIDKWLGVNDKDELRTPKILRTFIAYNSSDIYLLLMYLAQKNIENNIDIEISDIKALAFLTHWFGNDKKRCANTIFKYLKDGINKNNILKALSVLFNNNALINIYSPENIKRFIELNESKEWRPRFPGYANDFFNKTFYLQKESKEMLLYATREYINSKFSRYDPAQRDLFEDHNRPWDYDHIVPKDWIAGCQGKRIQEYSRYDQAWLNCIGNMAPISFEANRSKNDNPDFNEYNDNKDSLCYCCVVEKLNHKITRCKKQSFCFAKITFKRYIEIYKRIYEMIKPVIQTIVLSDGLTDRKKLFDKIKKDIPEAKFHFAVEVSTDDYWIEQEQDWTRKWIGIGIIHGPYMACFECGTNHEGNPIDYEIGIRKTPGTMISEDNRILIDGNPQDAPWWYKCETMEKVDDNHVVIVNKLNEIINSIKTVKQ